MMYLSLDVRKRECTLTLSRLELLRMLEDDEAGGKKANKTTITISLALLVRLRRASLALLLPFSSPPRSPLRSFPAPDSDSFFSTNFLYFSVLAITPFAQKVHLISSSSFPYPFQTGVFFCMCVRACVCACVRARVCVGVPSQTSEHPVGRCRRWAAV